MTVLAEADQNVVRITRGPHVVTIHKFGATVISWKVAGSEQLFLSSMAFLDGSRPIRGGTPIVFPQFGQGPMMKGQHGFARSQWWQVEEQQYSIKARLTHTADTLAIWPHKFCLEYIASLGEDGSLSTRLSVVNTDSEPFEFTALLHTYFSIDDLQTLQLYNLKGLTFSDKLKGGERFTQHSDTVIFDCEVDRAYYQVPKELNIQSSKGHLVIKHTFPDAVVWNPWIEKSKTMADFGDEEFKKMVCVEVGHVEKPLILPPGASWTADQVLITLKN